MRAWVSMQKGGREGVAALQHPKRGPCQEDTECPGIALQ